MTATAPRADEAARRYIDRIQEINERYGFGGPLTDEAYEKAVSEVAVPAAWLRDRVHKS